MSTRLDETKKSVPRWGMVIDVNRCVGCQTCTIACKHANDTPPGVQWRSVLDVEQGTYPDVERLFLVVGCQHCEEPPCVPVCPTGATRQREDGLVTMNYDVCIGCAYCAVSCPYQARTIVHDQKGYFGKQTRQEVATGHPERVSVAQKCSFCKERIDTGLELGLMPGVDPDATPACAASCISQAIKFGDFNDAESNVSRLVRDQPSMQLNAELGTNPQIRYLYTTPAVPGRDPATETEAETDERLSDPANPLAGALQKFWDWRAAMNWIFGGIGTGLAIGTGLGLWAGVIGSAQAPALYVASAALMSVGLFCVFLKIGQKLRFWRAASRPHTSWMTRELYTTGVFFPSVLACLVFPGPLAFALASISAAAFLGCQAKILHRARGIPVWRAPLIPWMPLASGLLEGCGALAILAAPALRAAAPAPYVIGLAMVVVNALLWRAYVGSARSEGIGPRSRLVLDALTPTLHLCGHLLPAVLIVLAWFIPGSAGVLLALAGAAAIAGGAMWKFKVIVRASFTQGFNLPRLPQRGSGNRAAPNRMDASAIPMPAGGTRP